MLLMAIHIGAQGWQKIYVEADELKGEKGGEVFMFTDPNVGSFVVWDFNRPQFRLVSDKELFNTTIASGFGYTIKGLTAIVGIYDSNGNLKEKFNMWLDLEDNTSHRFVRTRDAGGMSNPVGQKGKVKKIFKALQSSDGYVRIVAERYNSSDFDLKITPFEP